MLENVNLYLNFKPHIFLIMDPNHVIVASLSFSCISDAQFSQGSNLVGASVIGISGVYLFQSDSAFSTELPQQRNLNSLADGEGEGNSSLYV